MTGTLNFDILLRNHIDGYRRLGWNRWCENLKPFVTNLKKLSPKNRASRGLKSIVVTPALRQRDLTVCLDRYLPIAARSHADHNFYAPIPPLSRSRRREPCRPAEGVRPPVHRCAGRQSVATPSTDGKWPSGGSTPAPQWRGPIHCFSPVQYKQYLHVECLSPRHKRSSSSKWHATLTLSEVMKHIITAISSGVITH